MGQVTPNKKNKIDSLQQVIKEAKHDSVIVKAWFAWDNIIYASDPELDLKLNKSIDSLCDVNLDRLKNKDERKFFLKKKGYCFK